MDLTHSLSAPVAIKSIAPIADPGLLKIDRYGLTGHVESDLTIACFLGKTPQMSFMNATKPQSPKTSLTVTHVLAELLERLEHSTQPVAAGQYRSVVLHLIDEFAEVEPGLGLRALLDTHPAASELYENVNYQQAGLCRSSLDAAMAAESQARQAISRAMSRVNNPSTIQPKEDPNHGKS
jgi:hypothetical protein